MIFSKRPTPPTESGRTIFETLGVLAIMGLLTYTAYKGVTNGLDAHRIQKTLDLHQRMTTVMQQLFANKPVPYPVTTAQWVDFGLYNRENYDEGASCGHNEFRGDLILGVDVTELGKMVTIKYTEIPYQTCAKFITTDWGFNNTSGLKYLDVNETRTGWQPDANGNTLPISVPRATTLCQADRTNTLVFYYLFR